jgi:4-hydroxy-2-oxoheptanedioate aldolase
VRTSKSLQKIKSDKAVRICGLGNYLPHYICYAANAGYDCIWLDLEHRSFDEREVQSLLAFCRMYDIDCVVRPAVTDPAKLYHYLEDGATGLMMPHISTEAQARAVADAAKFPPLGNRGLDGAGLDSDFILSGGPEYTKLANQETFLLVQIEDLQAVENVEAITAVPGVDGLFVGTGDLRLQLEHSNSKLTLDDAIDRVAAAAQKHSKFWGCPMGTIDQMKDYTARGARLVAHGNDLIAVKNYLESMGGDFKQAGIE